MVLAALTAVVVLTVLVGLATAPPHTAAPERAASGRANGPDSEPQRELAEARQAETQDDGEHGASARAGAPAAEPRELGQQEASTSSGPATITAAEPADPALLAEARRTAAAWAQAFATVRPGEDTAAWLDRLRPHTTSKLHAALADSDPADLFGQQAEAAEPLAAEISAASAERIAVRVRLALDDPAGEHVLELVVVPTAAGPRVDEVRL